MQWPHVATVAMAPAQVKFHTHEYDYKGHNLASTTVTQYHSGVGYTQGFPKLTKTCSHFPKIHCPALISKAGYNGNNGYSVQRLVAKVRDTVANG